MSHEIPGYSPIKVDTEKNILTHRPQEEIEPVYELDNVTTGS